MRKPVAFIFLSSLLLAGCSEYGYRYQPRHQQLSNRVYADYKSNGETVDILIDTNGFRLQTVSILKSDGTYAKPTSIDYPRFEDELMNANGYQIHGPSFARGPTIAHFKAADVGAQPWEIQMQIESMGFVAIRIPS